MTVSEKVAYLKGLAAGLAINADAPEGKLFSAVIDTLQEVADEIEDINVAIDELGEGLTPFLTIWQPLRMTFTTTITIMMTRTTRIGTTTKIGMTMTKCMASPAPAAALRSMSPAIRSKKARSSAPSAATCLSLSSTTRMRKTTEFG